jgi:hypothetical protein
MDWPLIFFITRPLWILTVISLSPLSSPPLPAYSTVGGDTGHDHPLANHERLERSPYLGDPFSLSRLFRSRSTAFATASSLSCSWNGFVRNDRAGFHGPHVSTDGDAVASTGSVN